jgi:flagellar biosynthesis/type III secretory pathway protein FliH
MSQRLTRLITWHSGQCLDTIPVQSEVREQTMGTTTAELDEAAIKELENRVKALKHLQQRLAGLTLQAQQEVECICTTPVHDVYQEGIAEGKAIAYAEADRELAVILEGKSHTP